MSTIVPSICLKGYGRIPSSGSGVGEGQLRVHCDGWITGYLRKGIN